MLLQTIHLLGRISFKLFHTNFSQNHFESTGMHIVENDKKKRLRNFENL